MRVYARNIRDKDGCPRSKRSKKKAEKSKGRKFPNDGRGFDTTEDLVDEYTISSKLQI